MINLAVIEIKDVMKYLVKITIILTIVMTITRYFSSLKGKTINPSEELGKQTFLSCLDITIPGIKENNSQETSSNINNNSNQKPDILKMALEAELGMIDNLTKKKEEQQEGKEDIEKEENDEELSEAKTGLTTEVQESNVPQKFTVTSGSVKIKNETDIKLTKEMLKPTVNINMNNLLIYHTHTCESYTQSEKYKYKASGNFRTTNIERSVVRVGTELEKYMKNYGYSVIHDTTLYDYPAYNGSYDRSLSNVGKLLDKNNKKTDIVFDIHRDAIR